MTSAEQGAADPPIVLLKPHRYSARLLGLATLLVAPGLYATNIGPAP